MRVWEKSIVFFGFLSLVLFFASLVLVTVSNLYDFFSGPPIITLSEYFDNLKPGLGATIALLSLTALLASAMLWKVCDNMKVDEKEKQMV